MEGRKENERNKKAAIAGGLLVDAGWLQM